MFPLAAVVVVVVDAVVVVVVGAADAGNTATIARTPAPAGRRSLLNIVQLLPSIDRIAAGMRPGRPTKHRVGATATATRRAGNVESRWQEARLPAGIVPLGSR